jgi:hypothetical protein
MTCRATAPKSTVPNSTRSPRAALLALEKRLFERYERAERLDAIHRRPPGLPIGSSLRFWLTRHTYEMARKETRLIDLERRAAVAMVGCGIFPATLIFLAENCTIPRIVGIDRDPEVIGLAEELISHTGHRISLVCGPGSHFDFGGFDLIYIANGTNEKSAVLARAAATCPDEAEFVVRIPFGPGRLFYQDLDGELPPGLSLRRRGSPDLIFLNRILNLQMTPR